MDVRHLDNLADIEATYWWSVAKRDLVRKLLTQWAPPPGMLVEGGVGAGTNLVAFREMGYEVRGLDASPEAIGYCRDRDVEASVHDLQEPWPVEPASLRVVALLDVLEHLEDPALALKNAAALLEDGGHIVVTVPAIPWLLGPWDEMLGHLRRYSPDMLTAHAEAAGLQVRWWSHWNAFSLAPALMMRLAEKVQGHRDSAEFPPVPAPVNAGLLAAARVERKLMTMGPVPLGLSIAAVLTP